MSEYAIVELMGHVRLVGRLSEVERFGSKMGQIDVIGPEGNVLSTQFFGGQSVYRITTVDEATALAFATECESPVTVPWSVHRHIEALEDKRKTQADRSEFIGDMFDDDDEEDR